MTMTGRKCWSSCLVLSFLCTKRNGITICLLPNLEELHPAPSTGREWSTTWRISQLQFRESVISRPWNLELFTLTFQGQVNLSPLKVCWFVLKIRFEHVFNAQFSTMTYDYASICPDCTGVLPKLTKRSHRNDAMTGFISGTYGC